MGSNSLSRPNITAAQIAGLLVGGVPIVASLLQAFGVYTLSQDQQDALTSALNWGVPIALGLFGADAGIRAARNHAHAKVESQRVFAATLPPNVPEVAAEASSGPSDATEPSDSGEDPEWLAKALEHATGTQDEPHPARLSPELVKCIAPNAQKKFSRDQWLPAGFHNGLHIEHRPLESAGPMSSGGKKFLHHITVSPPDVVDAMFGVLRDKRAAPHLILGFRRGTVRPVLIQCIPFNFAGRALEHPGGPETNRANVIQLEICANVGDVPHFNEWGLYKALANVVRMVNDVVPGSVPARLARSFHDTNRFGGQQFVDVAGHCGHMHVPQNSHFDPTTAYLGSKLMTMLHDLKPGKFYDLSGVRPR